MTQNLERCCGHDLAERCLSLQLHRARGKLFKLSFSRLLAVRTFNGGDRYLDLLVPQGVHLQQVPRQALRLVWVSKATQLWVQWKQLEEKMTQLVIEAHTHRTSCRSKSWLRLVFSCLALSGSKLRYVEIHGVFTSS